MCRENWYAEMGEMVEGVRNVRNFTFSGGYNI